MSKIFLIINDGIIEGCTAFEGNAERSGKKIIEIELDTPCSIKITPSQKKKLDKKKKRS